MGAEMFWTLHSFRCKAPQCPMQTMVALALAAEPGKIPFKVWPNCPMCGQPCEHAEGSTGEVPMPETLAPQAATAQTE